jgi:hypothetical protein
MADRSDVGWATCAQAGCIGVRLSSGDRCFAHADPGDQDAALQRLRTHRPFNVQGVPFADDLLERVLEAAPDDGKGHAVLRDALV